MRRFSTFALVLFSAALFSACGKNMAVRIGAGGGASGSALKKDDGAQNLAKLGSVPAIVTIDDGGNYISTGTLQPHSLKDQTDLKSALQPQDYAGVHNLGQSPLRTKVGLRKFIQNGIYIFRGVYQHPAAELNPSVTEMKLVLRGVRRFVKANGAEKGLENQILCAIGSKLCTGKMPANDALKAMPLFQGNKDGTDILSPVALPVDLIHFAKDGADKGKLISLAEKEAGVEGELVLDLLKAFPEYKDFAFLTGAKGSEPYAEPNYRKIRFVLADQTFFDAGDLIVKFSVDPAKAKAAKINEPVAVFLGGGDDARMKPGDLVTPENKDDEVCEECDSDSSSDSYSSSDSSASAGGGNPSLVEPNLRNAPADAPAKGADKKLMITDDAGTPKSILDINDPSICDLLKDKIPGCSPQNKNRKFLPSQKSDFAPTKKGHVYVLDSKDQPLVDTELSNPALCGILVEQDANLNCPLPKEIPAGATLPNDALVYTDGEGATKLLVNRNNGKDPSGKTICDQLKAFGLVGDCDGADKPENSITPASFRGELGKSTILVTNEKGMPILTKGAQLVDCRDLVNAGVNIRCKKEEILAIEPIQVREIQTLPSIQNEILGAELRFKIPNELITFASGSADLTAAASAKLQVLVNALTEIESKHPGAVRHLMVVGSTDQKWGSCKGSQKNACIVTKNFDLARKRATAVSKVLNTSQGNIKFISYGLGLPHTSACGTADCAKDRVVELALEMGNVDPAVKNSVAKILNDAILSSAFRGNVAIDINSNEKSILDGGRYYRDESQAVGLFPNKP